MAAAGSNTNNNLNSAFQLVSLRNAEEARLATERNDVKDK